MEPVAIRVRWIDQSKIQNYEMKLVEFLQDVEKVCKIISTKHYEKFIQIRGVCLDKLPILVLEYANQRDL